MSRACPESVVPQPWSHSQPLLISFPRLKYRSSHQVLGVNSGGRISISRVSPFRSFQVVLAGWCRLVLAVPGSRDGHQQESQSDSSGTYRWMSFILKGWEGCVVTFHFPWAFSCSSGVAQCTWLVHPRSMPSTFSVLEIPVGSR